MRERTLLLALGQVDESYLQEAADTLGRTVRRPRYFRRLGTLAACLLLAAAAILGANAYAMSDSEALLLSTAAPPEGLTLQIVDAAPDDAEFLLVNETGLTVTCGRASRILRKGEDGWSEVFLESRGIFPPGITTLSPGQSLYGMCGWISRRLLLESGSYRYCLAVEIQDPRGTYPVVLEAEFTIAP